MTRLQKFLLDQHNHCKKMDLLNFDIDKSTKIYFSIGEVAKMLDVNTSLVRFWEKEFEILKPKKNKKGNKNHQAALQS